MLLFENAAHLREPSDTEASAFACVRIAIRQHSATSILTGTFPTPFRKARQLNKYVGGSVMRSDKSVGRKVGILLPLQMALALILPFVLIDALVKGYPSYLETAASSAG